MQTTPRASTPEADHCTSTNAVAALVLLRRCTTPAVVGTGTYLVQDFLAESNILICYNSIALSFTVTKKKNANDGASASRTLRVTQRLLAEHLALPVIRFYSSDVAKRPTLSRN